jgi:hypothetical protein
MPERIARRRCALGLVILVSGMLLAAAPAAAYLRDFQLVSAGSLPGSTTIRAALPTCPPGKIAIGTGARLLPPFANVGLDRLLLDFGARRGFVGGAETDANLGRWRVSGRAFCAQDTAAVPTAGANASYLKHRSTASAVSPNTSAPSHEAVANCPSGANAVGGGGYVLGPTTKLALDTLQLARPGGTGWRVRAHEVDPTGAAWHVVSFAICANYTTSTPTGPYFGPKEDAITSYSSSATGTGQVSATATCQLPGTSAIGGGAAVQGATPLGPPPADVALTYSFPGPNAWVARAQDTDPSATPYRLLSVVVCG